MAIFPLTPDQTYVLTTVFVAIVMWRYHGGSPTAIQAWQTCPLWDPSPSHPILL